MKRRGFSLMELMTSMMITVLVVFGSMTMLIAGLKSFKRTTDDVTITNQNAQGLRRVVQSIRGAMSVTLESDGRVIRYTNPALAATIDPVTGERELIAPMVSDGVNRGFSVDLEAGTLTDLESGRVLVRNISSFDPDPASSQYQQVYAPFQLTTIGAYKAISVNLITRVGAGTEQRYQRMKTTVLVRNAQ